MGETTNKVTAILIPPTKLHNQKKSNVLGVSLDIAFCLVFKRFLLKLRFGQSLYKWPTWQSKASETEIGPP